MAENKAAAKKTGGFKARLEAVKQFFKDTRSELKKVVWPSKEQVRNNTLVVIVVVVVAAAVMILLDFLFGGIMHMIIGA